MKHFLKLATISALCFSLVACSQTPSQGSEPLEGKTMDNIEGKTPDQVFSNVQWDLTLKLLKDTREKGTNSLVSPLSVILAMSMATNGADGRTLEEIMTSLFPNVTMDDWNKYVYSYLQSLPDDDGFKLHIADSIWMKSDENFQVNQEFLDICKNYYQAEVMTAPFDKTTVNDINNWVNEKTDGMIPTLLKDINADTILFIINALCFDAEWEISFEKNSTHDFNFFAENDITNVVEMMRDTVYSYIETEHATGFVKSYKNGYKFIALLPEEGMDLDTFLASFTMKDVRQLSLVQNIKTKIGLPKFKYDADYQLVDFFKQYGINDAFDDDNADFSKLGTYTDRNIKISSIIHKTHIEVDEEGTKAAAATMISFEKTSAVMEENFREVILNRPFVYFIIDGNTNTPVFAGTVANIQK
ncbi:MAG: serpin family protein [Erysipelotrichaceae bacterium]|nr:serpin family protein [Erysipelotrichaceae bacterium]